MIHPDNIPDTNMSLPNKKEAETMHKESENSEKYLIPHEKLTVLKNNSVKVEMLNCINCSTVQREIPGKNKNSMQSETLNYVNVSLISAPCQVTRAIQAAVVKDVMKTDVSGEQETGLVWNKLTEILSKSR